MNYSDYLAMKMDGNIEYTEYISENLNSNIDFSNYIAENLDKSLDYAEYLAETLNPEEHKKAIKRKLRIKKIKEIFTSEELKNINND